ncbi:PEPxxWA-CTERM sorting domain-containing protein [Sphingomonas abaci]|uniref:Ice-binding protein C-terminal domain-containing protein n=1 Tax=Sphingomonas abaci TaxID=237611 RepID=A0A7W7AKT8_9SPHN|nr:PEPxxWA-CTERM sorting domain-containing protein [Sphingomonas abaci]MBB4618059.1 hypothetical protein [Sphingomonas abaci]
MTKFKPWAIAAIGAVAMIAPATAQAATVFTDRAQFLALGGTPSYTTDFSQGTNPLLIFQVAGEAVEQITPVSGYEAGLIGSVDGSAFVQVLADVAITTVFSFTSTTQALGFDLRPYFAGELSDAGETVGFLTDTGEMGSFTLSSLNEVGFLGFSFDTPIEQLAFYRLDNEGGADASTAFGIDNVVGYAAAVPEPSSWAMMLVGFAMLGAGARYRRRSATVAYA